MGHSRIDNPHTANNGHKTNDKDKNKNKNKTTQKTVLTKGKHFLFLINTCIVTPSQVL